MRGRQAALPGRHLAARRTNLVQVRSRRAARAARNGVHGRPGTRRATHPNVHPGVVAPRGRPTALPGHRPAGRASHPLPAPAASASVAVGPNAIRRTHGSHGSHGRVSTRHAVEGALRRIATTARSGGPGLALETGRPEPAERQRAGRTSAAPGVPGLAERRPARPSPWPAGTNSPPRSRPPRRSRSCRTSWTRMTWCSIWSSPRISSPRRRMERCRTWP